MTQRSPARPRAKYRPLPEFRCRRSSSCSCQKIFLAILRTGPLANLDFGAILGLGLLLVGISNKFHLRLGLRLRLGVGSFFGAFFFGTAFFFGAAFFFGSGLEKEVVVKVSLSFRAGIIGDGNLRSRLLGRLLLSSLLLGHFGIDNRFGLDSRFGGDRGVILVLHLVSIGHKLRDDIIAHTGFHDLGALGAPPTALGPSVSFLAAASQPKADTYLRLDRLKDCRRNIGVPTSCTR